MTREFYNALQMDPSVLKRRIAACGTRGEKTFYRTAMAVRAAFGLAFAALFRRLALRFLPAAKTAL